MKFKLIFTLAVLFIFSSDYGYYREPDSEKCVRDAVKPPDLCINGDIEKLKDTVGFVLSFCCIIDWANNYSYT